MTAPEPSCAVCGATLRPWFVKMDRGVFRCPSCGHVSVPAGVARRADGRSIYESDDSIFESDGNQDYYLDSTNADAAETKLAYVIRHVAAGGRLLDIGASYGHFLAAARRSFEASGIEVSPAAAESARATFNVPVQVGNVYELPAEFTGAFDVVTCWDVIEHLEDPAAALREMRRCLRPSGLLCLSTPDAGSAVARAMGRRWHYLDPVQHINLFSRGNLVHVLTRSGFAFVDGCHFGRRYRTSYIANRLSYLSFGRAVGAVDRLPRWLAASAVPIKLWDVMGLAARRTDVSA